MTRAIRASVLLALCGLAQPAMANDLTPGTLTRLVVSQTGSDNLPQVAPGTTSDRMRASDVAGLIASQEGERYALLVALGIDTLCRLHAEDRILDMFSADLAEAIAAVMRPALGDRQCRGVLHLGKDGSPHVFLQLDPVAEGRSGVWISAEMQIPVLHLPSLAPSPDIARAIMQMDPLPATLVAIGKTRFATEAENGIVSVHALDDEGVVAISVPVCAPEEHPLFSPSPFRRHGVNRDAAYQAVMGNPQYDPLAYVVCP